MGFSIVQDMANSERISLSYSGFKLLNRCPYAYKLKYVDRLIDPKKLDHRNFLVGTVCHSCLHRWIVETGCKPDWMNTIVEQEFHRAASEHLVCWRGEKDHALLLGRAKEYVAKIQEAYIILQLPTQNIRSEWSAKYYVIKHNATLIGQIDLYDPSTHVVYDLKASDDRQYFDREQGLFYSLIISCLKGKQVEKFGQFVPLCKNPIEWSIFDRSDFINMCHRVGEAIAQIRRHDFPKNTDSCHYCEFRAVCGKAKQP